MIDYLSNITVPVAQTILANIARSIERQCDEIIANNGRVAVFIDQRLEAKRQELEDLVTRKKSIGDAVKDKEDQIATIDIRIAQCNEKLKGLRSSYQQWRTADTKGDKATTARLQERYDEYLALVTEVMQLEKDKEPLIREYSELQRQMAQIEKGYGREQRDSFAHWYAMVQRRLERLERLKQDNDSMLASGMRENKKKFVEIFTNPDELKEIVAVLEMALIRMTNGKFGKVGRNLQEQYFFNSLNALREKDYEYLPFEHINEREKCRRVYSVGGQTCTVYDLSLLPASAIRKGFYVVLTNAVQTVAAPFMHRMFHEFNNLEQYIENSKDELNTDQKRVELSVEENGIFCNPHQHKIRSVSDLDRISEIWGVIARQIKDETEDMAGTTYQSIQFQLPSHSYYLIIPEENAIAEFRQIFDRLVILYGNSIQNSGKVSDRDVKTYINDSGCIARADRKVVSSVMACVFNLKILELMESLVKGASQMEGRPRQTWEDTLLNNISKKYKELSEGLYDYRKVTASRMACAAIESKRIQRQTFEVLTSGFEPPEEAASRLLRETRDYGEGL